jgi:hypothetical protein
LYNQTQIESIESQLNTKQDELNNPDLTDDQKQAIQAEIMQLKQSKNDYVIANESAEKEKGMEHIVGDTVLSIRSFSLFFYMFSTVTYSFFLSSSSDLVLSARDTCGFPFSLSNYRSLSC